MQIKVNAEMFGKAFYFTGDRHPKINIVPSNLGGINIIATDGYRLAIFNDQNGKCSSNGVSIGRNSKRSYKTNKLIRNARLIKNCSKNITIKFYSMIGKGTGKAILDNKTFEVPEEVEIENKPSKFINVRRVIPKNNDCREKIDMYNYEVLNSLKHLNLRSIKNERYRNKFFSINKDTNGMLILTSENVFFLAMPFKTDVPLNCLYDLWSGAAGGEEDLLQVALAKKKMLESIEKPYVQSIFHAFTAMKQIKLRN